MKSSFTILWTWKTDYNTVIILVKLMTVINKKPGSILQPTFSKIESTFVSDRLSSTWRRVPTTSLHSFLEYWVFSQHWRSKVTIRLVSSVFTCLVTASTDWGLLKLLLNLRISSSNSLLLLFLSVIVLSKLSTWASCLMILYSIF